jgi:hypothetical protein
MQADVNTALQPPFNSYPELPSPPVNPLPTHTSAKPPNYPRPEMRIAEQTQPVRMQENGQEKQLLQQDIKKQPVPDQDAPASQEVRCKDEAEPAECVNGTEDHNRSRQTFTPREAEAAAVLVA